MPIKLLKSNKIAEHIVQNQYNVWPWFSMNVINRLVDGDYTADVKNKGEGNNVDWKLNQTDIPNGRPLCKLRGKKKKISFIC